MIGGIFRFIGAALSFANKLLPSWEWKGGQAAAERDQMKETMDARKRMDNVPAPDERAVTDSLRKGKF